MEYRRWWRSGEQRLLWLQNPMGEGQSLSHCAQQNVEAGCRSGGETFCGLFSSASCVRVSSFEDRPLCSLCLQAHLSHARASQVSVLMATAFRSRLRMSLKRSWGLPQPASFQLTILPREGPLGYGCPPYGDGGGGIAQPVPALPLVYGVHGGNACPPKHLCCWVLRLSRRWPRCASSSVYGRGGVFFLASSVEL